MSSKNVEGVARRLSFFSAPWSIAARLTLLYTVSAFAMLLLAAGFLHWTLAVNFRREDAQFLADKVALLRTILGKTAANSTDLKEEVKWEAAALHFARYYARVLDRSGHTIIESPGMSRVLPATMFSAAVSTAPLESQVLTRISAHGRKFLLLSAAAPPGYANDKRQIQVALDVSPEDAFLQRYRHDLAWAVLFGVLFSAAVGAFVARRGMKPLAELTQATDRISASQLHERIAGEGWPKELALLATGFDRMLDRLEESFQRLSRFSGDLAHELRTPVNNLRGEAGVALSQARLPEEYRHTLESGLEEYARLTSLIDNLLFLARADSPTTKIVRIRCDAQQAITSVCEFYEALAEDRGVDIRCEGRASISADPVLFRQAVSNLLSNAINHTPRGGQVIIRTARNADGQVMVDVSDTGCGIAAQHLPYIFDRLYRVDPARSNQRSGTGLGLAIVKSIMNLHGGAITVESTVDIGSRFTLAFPANSSVA